MPASVAGLSAPAQVALLERRAKALAPLEAAVDDVRITRQLYDYALAHGCRAGGARVLHACCRLEPKAVEILKAASARLAAAKSMAFTAVVSYESPSRLGTPLVYTTRSEVTLQRPDKLRVITPGATSGELLHMFSSLERCSERWASDPEAARCSLSAAVSLVLRRVLRAQEMAEACRLAEGNPGLELGLSLVLPSSAAP